MTVKSGQRNLTCWTIGVWLLVGMVGSCTHREEPPVSLHQIVAKSRYDSLSAQPSTPNDDTIALTHLLSLEQLRQHAIQWDSVLNNEQLTFLDRFNPMQSHKIIYYVENKEVHYFEWSFSDSLKTATAFLNWMNCFGKNCQTVALYQEVPLQKSATLIMQNRTQIIVVQTEVLSIAELLKWKNAHIHNTTTDWQTIITQPRNGKTRWSKIENGQEQEMVNNNNKNTPND